MRQNDYSVVIAQRIEGDGFVNAPVVVALIRHEGDMRYLTEVVRNLRMDFLYDSNWREINVKGLYKDADFGFKNIKNGDEMLLFVSQPYGGWNL